MTRCRTSWIVRHSRRNDNRQAEACHFGRSRRLPYIRTFKEIVVSRLRYEPRHAWFVADHVL
jgi:hypothetical protein